MSNNAFNPEHTPYHEILRPTKDMLNMLFRGINQVIHPEIEQEPIEDVQQLVLFETE